MNRRGFLRGLLAGAALATGLARTRLELIDERLEDFWAREYQASAAPFDEDALATLAQAWDEVAAGPAPDFIHVSPEVFETLTYRGVPIVFDGRAS